MRANGIFEDEVDQTPMQIRGLLLTGLLVVGWAAWAGAAWAQQVPADDLESTEEVESTDSDETTPGIEERVVLAGESEGARDFAAGDSVKGFNAADLEALGAQNIADLAKFTPNLEIVTAGSTAPTFFIRGVGLNDFNANSAGAVSIYQDDVPLNAPALQLGTLFDMEAVNVERGPQGTGPFRNASAGAIKLYARKPSGNYGGYLRSQYGRFNYVDIEGAVEAPVYEDILAARASFRYRDRKGFAKNDCGGAPPNDQREVRGPLTANAGFRDSNPLDPDHPSSARERYLRGLAAVGVDESRITIPDNRAPTDDSVSICGEFVERVLQTKRSESASEGFILQDGISDIPPGLPRDVNSQHNWAARGILRFQPTLDMDWLLNAHGSRRNEHSRLGQAAGINERGNDILGFKDGGLYQEPDQKEMKEANFARELEECGAPCVPAGEPRRAANKRANDRTARSIANNLDKRPYRGDFNRVGKTKNDTWGLSLKGDVVLPADVELRSVTGYDSYDRFTDVDLDQSPNILFEIVTDDDGWQFTEDLSFAFDPIEDLPVHMTIGGFYLMEELNVKIQNDFGEATVFGVANRRYTQKIWSAAGYLQLAWDFWEDFTLDGGVRYNYDKKEIDYDLIRAAGVLTTFRSDDWSEPTGTVRLTYRFREDTHAYWKYTRGWKGGHYNATSSLNQGVTVANPETIDAFEMGMRGAWFDGIAQLSVNLFYYDYKEYQLFVAQDSFSGQPEFVILNASDARVYGLEADLQLRPHSTTFVNVNFGWLESEFLDFVQVQFVKRTVASQSITVKNEIQNSGHRLLNSPEFKVSLTAEQTVPLGRYGALIARYDGAWTDDSYYDGTEGLGIPDRDGVQFLPENTIGQQAFWLHNVSLRYVDPTQTIELAGWVRNLTNQTYKTFAFDATTFRDTTIAFTGDPRTYGVTLGVRF